MTVQARTVDAGSADDAAMAARLFEDIARMSPDTEGVSRPAYSEIETKVLKYLEDFAVENGLEVWYDACCNANFCLPGDRDADSVIVVGSHADSVPAGGNYDGLAGIVAGLVCLVRARRSGAALARPVHVLAMRGEESAWFGPCYIGSKALTGTLSEADLAARHGGDGRPLSDHMADVGVPVERLRAGEPMIDLSRIAAYIELHIEQGPVLIGKDLPAAVVSGIRGNIRHRTIRCVGEAGHSGAVPRAFRRDSVLAMADLLTRLDEHWVTILAKGNDLVLTCGMVGTDPDKHAMSRIPDEVSFSLDMRSLSPTTLDEMRKLLASEIRQVERDRKVRFELDREMRVEPALCDPDLVARLTQAMESAAQEGFVMPSGAGHDAAVFAGAGIPTAMVFVRNRNGSHNPHEAMELDDFMAATEIIYQFLTGAS